MQVVIKGVKAVVESEKVFTAVKPKPKLPEKMIDRIQFNIKSKQSDGAILCRKCQKVWDKSSICKICQLTSWQVFESIDR